MPFEKDPNEIGVLWTKQGAKGEYLSGEINGQAVVVFPINSKNTKAPNWRVLKSVRREDAAPRPTHNANVREPGEDDIPY